MRFRTMTAAALMAGATAVGAGAALADDPMANTYGNTVVTTDAATGMTSKLMFNADHSYTAEAMGKDGKSVSYGGSWALRDDGKTICLTPKAPEGAAAPPASCSPLEKHAVGDSWKVTNDQKQSFEVSIKPGR